MIEPEMAFYDIHDNMQLATDLLRAPGDVCYSNCAEDLEFLDKRAREEEAGKPQDQRSELGLIDRLKFEPAMNFKN